MLGEQFHTGDVDWFQPITSKLLQNYVFQHLIVDKYVKVK